MDPVIDYPVRKFEMAKTFITDVTVGQRWVVGDPGINHYTVVSVFDEGSDRYAVFRSDTLYISGDGSKRYKRMVLPVNELPGRLYPATERSEAQWKFYLQINPFGNEVN